MEAVGGQALLVGLGWLIAQTQLFRRYAEALVARHDALSGARPLPVEIVI